MLTPLKVSRTGYQVPSPESRAKSTCFYTLRTYKDLCYRATGFSSKLLGRNGNGMEMDMDMEGDISSGLQLTVTSYPG